METFFGFLAGFVDFNFDVVMGYGIFGFKALVDVLEIDVEADVTALVFDVLKFVL